MEENEEKEIKEEKIDKTNENNEEIEKKQIKAHKSKKRTIIIIIISMILILAVLSVIFSLVNLFNNNIIQGVSINGIDVSGLSADEATNRLNSEIDKNSDKEIKFTYGDIMRTTSLNELEVNYDVKEAIEKATKVGREENIFINNFNIIKALILKQKIKMEVTYNEEKITELKQEIIQEVPNAVEESSYCIEDSNLIITKGKEGLSINQDYFEELIKDSINKIASENNSIEIVLEEKQPESIDIQKIHDEIYKEPQDAYVSQDPVVVHPSVDGIDFDVESAKQILEQDCEEYTIPLTITPASKTLKDLGEDAFPNDLGTFSTRYDATNKNRSNNISLASDKINGTIIMPGETFSYNTTVGKRTIEAGYKEAGAYAGGKVIQEIGGGICQVSSTLYNAVLYANLEIVSRSNHYFQCSYVDAGRDATVSWGSVDFKFKNNRTYPIEIVSKGKNGVVTITIKGIKEEKEYEVIISSKVKSIIDQEIKYEDDNTIEEGKQTVEQVGHNGCISETYKIVKLNGVTVSNSLISTDTYHALDKIIKVGTKKASVVSSSENNIENTSDNNNETINNQTTNNVITNNANNE